MKLNLIEEYFDEHSKQLKGYTYNYKYDLKATNPALRAPYEFCVEWMRKNCPNKKVLDYGCGQGNFSILWAKLGAFVTGIDISSKSLNIAKERAKHECLEKRTSFLVENCEELSFADDSFDIVFSSGVLAYLNLEKAYSELTRVVKRGGYVIIIDTLGHNPLLNLNRIIKYKRGIRMQEIEHILSINDFYKLSKFFGKFEIYFFDLSTILVAPFIKNNENFILFRLLIKITQTIDKFLLSLSILQKMAFKVVCVLSEPNKEYIKKEYANES